MLLDEVISNYNWWQRAGLQFSLTTFVYFWGQSDFKHMDVWVNISTPWRMSKRFSRKYFGFHDL